MTHPDPGEQPIEIAERALAHAFGETQVTVTHERSLVSRFARSRPTQATDVDTIEVTFTAVRDGHTGSASTTLLSDDALRATGGRAAASAAASAAHAGAGDYPGLPGPQDYHAHDGFDEATARLDPAVAGAALGAAFAAAAERDLEAFGIWTAGAVRTAIASSTGIRASDALTDAYMRVICRDPDGRSGFAAGGGTSTADVGAQEIARRSAAKVTTQERAELGPGEYPVVLDAEAVGTLLEFVGGLAFDGLAHSEGRGALSGRLGTQIASPAINLSDSPRFRRTLPRAFDAEGVGKAPLPLIQDGVAHAVCHDMRSAARAGGGARSTGHAISPGGSHGAIPTNLVLVGGGAAGVDELAAPIERGIYVTRLWYVNTVHPKQVLLTGMTRDGTFLIEDGRITRPLPDVRFTDSALRILAATEALAATPRLTAEAELYGIRFATGTVCPALRAQGFRVTGVKPD